MQKVVVHKRIIAFVPDERDELFPAQVHGVFGNYRGQKAHQDWLRIEIDDPERGLQAIPEK